MEPRMLSRWKFGLLLLLLCALSTRTMAQEKKPARKINKDIRDYTDADLETLLDQWEEDDDPLEPDELPEHLRPQPKIDISQLDMSDPDNILKMSKKGKSTMMFVDVDPELSESEAATVLGIWQSSLQNNHIIAERYPIDTKRAIFMFRDGAQAVDAKNYLIEQKECSHVTLEGQNHVGRYASENVKKKLESMNPTSKVEKVKKDKKKTEL